MAADTFLQEQLERIHELIARMQSLERHSAELPERLARDREALRQGPLYEVRDFRTVTRQEWERERTAAPDGSRRRRGRRKTATRLPFQGDEG